MPSKYPVLKPQEIIAALQKYGFCDSTYHDEVAKGTLKSILDMAGISLDDFKSNL